MTIKTNKDLLKKIRSLDNVQLNKSYRRQYIAELKDHIRSAKANNRAGVPGCPKAYIRRLESQLKNLDKNSPFIEKIKVEIG